MRLSEIDAETGFLEDLVICGLEPIERMLKLQQSEIEELDSGDVGNLSFFNDDIMNKVADLKDALFRFERRMIRQGRESIEAKPPTDRPSKPSRPTKRVS